MAGSVLADVKIDEVIVVRRFVVDSDVVATVIATVETTDVVEESVLKAILAGVVSKVSRDSIVEELPSLLELVLKTEDEIVDGTPVITAEDKMDELIVVK